MRQTETKKWDGANYLLTPEDCADYLNAVLEDGDDQELIVALGNIARSVGMTKVARKTGVTRDGLYKALSLNGNPSYTTVNKVLHAVGLRTRVCA